MDDELDPNIRSSLEALLGDGRPQHAEEPRRSLRARITRRHVTVAGLLLLVACAVAGWSVLRARATPVPAVAPPVLAAPTVAATTPTPKPRVTVHVVGAVASPGMVSLPEGARVADAIASAGGMRGDADPGELNLAEPVADGAQVKVGTAAAPGGEVRGAAAPGGGGAAGGTGPKVDLNTATAAQLEQLPGVGPVTAQRIVAWREQHGRFSRVEELQEVDGIGPKTFAQLAGSVRV